VCSSDLIDVLIDSMFNKKALDGPTNVGSGKGTTLFDLSKIIKNMVPTKSKIHVKPARTEEVVKYIASLDRYKNVFDIPIDENPLYALREMC